jgi:SHS family lactate transporter-like MFS transporter
VLPRADWPAQTRGSVDVVLLLFLRKMDPPSPSIPTFCPTSRRVVDRPCGGEGLQRRPLTSGVGGPETTAWQRAGIMEQYLGTRDQRHVVAACYLGWSLDAFDYFIMAFALDSVAATFHSSRAEVSWAFTLTLAMRPLGAFVFGRIADRFGRRPTLMANVIAYSVLEALSGFAPNLPCFLLLRALFGFAMGGEWGVGASLTMESIPARWRGPVSGLLQAGYPTGFLLATLLNQAAVAHVGWRGLFWLGVLPAGLVFYIRRNVPESPDWSPGRAAAKVPLARIVRQYWKLTLYAVAMMAAFNFFSHGTQDLYKSFLSRDHHLPLPTVTAILIAMNVAAIIGGITVASISQRVGRRRAIVAAALLCLPTLPLWAFASDPIWLGAGAFMMQLCVQGAWGVVPAHLNELSPPDLRATFPGVTYQLGNLLAAGTAPLQAGLASACFNDNLSWPLAIVTAAVAVVIAVMVGFGQEAKDVRMGRERIGTA